MIRGVIRDSLTWMWHGAKVQCSTSPTGPGLSIPSWVAQTWQGCQCAGAAGLGKTEKKAGTSPAAGKEGLGKQEGKNSVSPSSVAWGWLWLLAHKLPLQALVKCLTDV